MKSAGKKEVSINIPYPKDNEGFVGHAKAVEILETVLNSDRIPQSWLFCGPRGVGKATLAYRFARALLANSGDNLFGEKELFVSAQNPVFQRVAGGSHSDLLVIEPDKSAASGDIKVDEIRKINGFLRLTSSETKHRIVIIDSADNMNINAANALLKLLEEPPANAIFLLISHCPGRLLPTIKSRCRKLTMTGLSDIEAASVLETAIEGIAAHEADKVIALAEGSPGVAIDLYYNDGVNIYDAIMDILTSNPRERAALVEKLSNMVVTKGDNTAWSIMEFLLQSALMRIIRSGVAASPDIVTFSKEKEAKNQLLIEKPLEQLINLWDKINNMLLDTSRINLDKRAVLISIFEELR